MVNMALFLLDNFQNRQDYNILNLKYFYMDLPYLDNKNYTR